MIAQHRKYLAKFEPRVSLARGLFLGFLYCKHTRKTPEARYIDGMGKREILIAGILAAFSAGAGAMTQTDKPPVFYTGLALTVLALFGFVWFLFEDRIKSAPWGRAFQAIKFFRAPVIVAGCFIIGYGFARVQSVSTEQPSNTNSSLDTAKPILSETEPASPVIKNIPIDRITGYYKQHTDLEAEALVKPFIGVSVSTSGVVENIISHGKGEGGYISLKNPHRSPYVVLMFDDSKFLSVTRLAKGEKITAECVFIGKSSASGIILEKCRLTSGSM